MVMEHKFKLESEIRTKYQITIPEEIRVKAKLAVGDKLLWQYDEVRDEIIVMPKPNHFPTNFGDLEKSYG
jgi:bifunctional DNA-binding transcriptional regulator/antitoxin component of YhaV-PrlF toxin-antitoxin module